MHNDVNGIEVPLATEASGEIGDGIGCGIEVAAYRANKAEVSFGVFIGNFQDVPNKKLDRNFISQSPQEFTRQSSGHDDDHCQG